MIIETKICIKCGQKKEINNFRLRKDTGKYRNMCKDCEKKYKHENYTKNKEKILEKNKIYAKRVIDLWADAKKWKMLAKMTDNDEDYNKYMNVSNTLMEMFTKEIQDMKL